MMLGAIAVLLGFQLAGEALHRWCGVPLPGAVIGMVLLLGALVLAGEERGAGWRARLEPVSGWLSTNLAVMFVPAAVGVIELGAIFARFGVALALATGVSTVLALVVTALVLRAVAGGGDAA